MKFRYTNIKTFKLITLASVLLCSIYSCCNKVAPYPIAAVLIKFEGLSNSDMSNAWIIETVKNDSSTHLDTIFYGQLSQVNHFTIELEFEKYEDNGDYYIYADSIKTINKITDIDIDINYKGICDSEDISFSYLFNGELKTNKDDMIIINRE
jgi:hypothetical protein